MTLLDAPTLPESTETYLSFRLSDDFVARYIDRHVPWGFPCGGGNSLGELQFLSKYSALKPDGTKERWYEACRRVVEGFYTILKDHCTRNRTPWNHAKAQRAAEDAYDRMFHFKWLPPGRGLQHMGRPFIYQHGSAALQNCAFLSTEHLGPRNATQPFVRLMEMSMLGIGVGFDTLGAGKLQVHDPEGDVEIWTVGDSREGWCDSTERLLRSYLLPNQRPVEFDYSEVREAGQPIRGLGGVASGPGPLREQHDTLRRLLKGWVGQWLTSSDIVDLMNVIGKGVVSGNVRRSSELALGDPDDFEFLNLKNWEINPERMAPNGWGQLSNNSIRAEVGGDYSYIADNIELSGEPGLIYLDLAREYGRLVDAPDWKDSRARGVNPCAEQTLEDQECCTLVEMFPANHTELSDFLRTIKVAYLYAKAVTLMPTHWPETNEVMQRNRRIGCSVSGVVQFAEEHGWSQLRNWLDEGYGEVCRRDTQYSEWLGVRESIKKTSVKPSGTVSLLVGATPGVHFPVSGGSYWRRIRYAKNDPVVQLLIEAGYHVEDDVKDSDTTVVVTFPTRGPEVRSEREATLWEKMHLAAMLQRYWADNQVSATFSFSPSEAEQIPAVLRAFDGQLKSMSFLPMGDEASPGAYPQMPYERAEDAAFEASWNKIGRIDTEALYSTGREAEGEQYCTTDVCEIKVQ